MECGGGGRGGPLHGDLAAQQRGARGDLRLVSCPGGAVPRAGFCHSPSLPGLTGAQPPLLQRRRVVFGGPEICAGAAPLLSEQTG